MTQLTSITIDGITYIPKDSVLSLTSSGREVIVADRGWTFYGDVTEETDEYVQLDNGGVVQSYKTNGLPGACADPGKSDVVVKPGPRFRVAKRAIISRHSVAEGWMR